MRVLRRPFSLALRLTLLFGVLTIVVFPLFGWFISSAMENQLVEGDVAELQVIASAVQAALAGEPLASEAGYLRQRFDDILIGHHHASLHVAGKDGRAIYASPHPDLSRLARPSDNGPGRNGVRKWYDDDHIYRVLVRTAPNTGTAILGPYTLVVAVPIDYHQRFVVAFRRTLWLLVAICIVMVSLSGWILVEKGHAPLRDIVGQIHRISAERLNTHLPLETLPPELRDLAISFNEMLERVDASFHRLSDFNADIAHELRTPITNMMTQTQVALSRPRKADEYREILYSNMEECERISQMVGDMLFLAQTDNCLQIENFEEVNLADEVRALFEYYADWAEDHRIELLLEGAATLQADRHMLRRAIGNLLSNAIRHSPTDETVRVDITASNQGVAIAVENTGPAIPPEHLPRLFERFYRVDPSRKRGSQGTGLGLAIVKSIVTAHGGKIAITSTDGCTRFRINLPNQATKPAP